MTREQANLLKAGDIIFSSIDKNVRKVIQNKPYNEFPYRTRLVVQKEKCKKEIIDEVNMNEYERECQ